MKSEGSPSEVGPGFTTDAVSGDAHADDNSSDDEPETELEALQHLAPDERRKALRRLRNRESARRVRARRLAEMSQMESAMRGVKEENLALKSHVSKLQDHIQSMTLKVYEVTSKYESTVAENAQLRAELQRLRRPSAPVESSMTIPACTLAAAAGPNSAPPQISPFISPCDDADGGPMLCAGHAQLRSSSPMDLQQQRLAIEEVVFLLKEHKRRNQGAPQDRSAGSEIGSSGVVTNAATSSLTNAHSPATDVGLPNILPVFGAAGTGTDAGHRSLNTSSLSYNGNGGGMMLGPSPVLPTSAGACTAVGGRLSATQVDLQIMELMAKQSGAQAAACGMTSGMTGYGQQFQQQQPLPGMMQSRSQPLPQIQLPHQHQFGGQQHMQMPQPNSGLQAMGSAAYNSASSLSGAFYTAPSALPYGHMGQQHQQQGSFSGPIAHMFVGANGMACPGAGSVATVGNHRSASFALDRMGGGGMHPNAGGGSMPAPWQGACNNAGGAVGTGGALRQDEIPDDIFMSLDDFVPQDL